MEGLLTEVKTVKRDLDSFITPAADVPEVSTKHDLDLDHLSSRHIIDLLKSNPDREQLSAILAFIDPFSKTQASRDFDLRLASPITAQILQLLVSTTIPTHWGLLDSKQSKGKDLKSRAALLRCLSSVAGIGSLLAQLRTVIGTARTSAHQAQGSSSQLAIQEVLAVLAALTEPKDFILRLYSDISKIYDNKTRQQVAWRELVSLVAAGKILSTAAEALTVLDATSVSSSHWIATGPQYAVWIGRNVAHMAVKLNREDKNGWSSLALLTGRSLSLGYTDQFVKEVYASLLLEYSLPQPFVLLQAQLKPIEQTSFLEAVFRDIQRKHFSDDLSGSENQPLASSETIRAVAALCSLVIPRRSNLENMVIEWLSKSQGGSITTLGLRRALLITYGDRSDVLSSVLHRSLEQFGDKFSIKHVSNVVQNANAQIILLAAGHLQRSDKSRVQDAGRSSAYLNAVSNRLAASSNRAQFLGMIVGTGLSALIEQPDKVLKFDLDEMKSEEAQWYLNLTNVHDQVGSPDSIKTLQGVQPASSESTQSKPAPKAKTHAQRQGTSKIVAIEEIEDSEEENDDDDDDLIPYEKPDDDAYDSDDDPTLIQRNKPTAPVYIRDLIPALRDTENVEHHHLAITTAPSLIRRKIGFGTELAEQIEELALTIVGLQNDNNHPTFHESRLQSIIALIISQPFKMGRWFTAIYFDGDISQVQRSAVLTALGLSAREIAGNGEDDSKALRLPTTGDTSFPSKRLSPSLEAMYSGADKSPNESPIAVLTREMSRTSLQPLAANAADAMTGPNALKVRTFSSRMEVEKKRQQRDTQRQKSTIKDLHKVLAEGFFFPMQGRFEIMMLQISSSSSSSYNPFFIPHLLTLFLQTLSLILSTTGPSTPFLPGLTHEALSLLLSLHTASTSSEPTVTAALLSLFLAVVDLNIASGSNGEERLVTEYATQVIELREWASQVFDRTPPSAARADPSSAVTDPQEQIRTLAAGVMVRLGEVMERYQGRLMGVHSGFSY